MSAAIGRPLSSHSGSSSRGSRSRAARRLGLLFRRRPVHSPQVPQCEGGDDRCVVSMSTHELLKYQEAKLYRQRRRPIVG
mmetsp:Transcript_73016/g.219266  ORF Transcript_73016/g.219266 Transcript_73016/m.219266 type:complete len:80 (+) Transcript_73016:111-350(+)